MDYDEAMFAALDELTDALRENSARNERVVARAHRMRQLRREGLSWTEICAEEERPLIVEMLTRNLDAIGDAGSRLRRLEARALHDEGMSMERIARLFGVTRQRVSELLRETSS
jgi:transcriptional regulator with XRE-family HTH domain